MRARECMLCWNNETKAVSVIKWPDDKMLSHGLFAVGANHNAFRERSKNEQALALITEGIYLHTHFGFSMLSVLEALRKIDECRSALDRDHFDI